MKGEGTAICEVVKNLPKQADFGMESHRAGLALAKGPRDGGRVEMAPATQSALIALLVVRGEAEEHFRSIASRQPTCKRQEEERRISEFSSRRFIP